MARRQREEEERQRREHDLRRLRGKVAEIAALWPVAPPDVLFDDSVANAQADGDGKIRVNQLWFVNVCADACGTQDAPCERALAYWLLAHEMTHLVFKDPQAFAALDRNVPPWIREYHHHDRELRADWFGGRALAHFGEDIGAIDRVSPSLLASDTHPALADRIRAAKAGHELENQLAVAAE